MKRVCFYFVLVGLLPGLFFPKVTEKKLTSDKLVFDFGEIREGRNPRVWFYLTNFGTKEIRIQELRTFAACVQSRPIEKKILSPGQTIELDLVFESLGYGGAEIEKSIEIHYDDPKKSPLKLWIRGTVLPLESYQASLDEMIYNYFVLVDIRPAKDYSNGHILGALNIPVERLDAWVSSISKSLSEDIIVYVLSEEGNESDRAVKLLREKGYSQFLSIVGGMNEWKHQNGSKFLVSQGF